ncbi:hypothetical protein LXL04_014436 [Taraxacum kok-saghyz]
MEKDDNSSPTIHTLPLKTPELTIVNFPSSLKLSSTNYLSWKTQIEALLYGLDLFKFIDGSNPSPAPTVAADGTSKPHKDFDAWFRQDRLLFGAIVGTLSSSIVPLITNAKSSLDAWSILSKTYANPSRGHIKQLQYRLKQTSKSSDQTITDYMQTIKTLVDELSILGKKMDTEDITDAVLTGLDSTAYKSVIDAIHARDSAISFHELHEKLINHELSLAQSSPTTNLHQPASAFAATKRNPTKPWNHRQSNNNQPILPTPNQPSTTTSKYLGKCQFCFTKGHSLTSCYAFKNKYPQINLPSIPRTTYNNNNPQAHMMNTTTDSNSGWLFDSGASHHITNDLNALSMHTPYDGTDELVIGDGLQNQPNSTPRDS